MVNFKSRNILVTGGAGFIGSHWIRYILGTTEAVKVLNLDLLTYAGSKDNLVHLTDPKRHVFVQGDICDQGLIRRLLHEYHIDTIVHFAAESHVDRSILGPAAFIQTNVNGTFTLLEEARKYWLEDKRMSVDQHRFHHISTDEVYGTLRPDDQPFSETTPYAPNSPYSASKAASDHLVRAYQHTYGLSTTMTNCSNNYGPFQHGEKFIPTIIRACLKGNSIPVYGDGSNIRDWLYVEDHCVAVWLVVQRGRIGATYNVGGSNSWNNLAIARLLCSTVASVLGKPEGLFLELIRFVPDRLGHDWRYAINSSKIQNELSWKAAESFQTGIRRTVEWYIARREASSMSPGNTCDPKF